MNPFQTMQNVKQMMSNPIGAMQQQMLSRMQRQNPQRFNQIKQMVEGKNDSQLKEMAQNIAKERGVDLDQFASQFNIRF